MLISDFKKLVKSEEFRFNKESEYYECIIKHNLNADEIKLIARNPVNLKERNIYSENINENLVKIFAWTNDDVLISIVKIM